MKGYYSFGLVETNLFDRAEKVAHEVNCLLLVLKGLRILRQGGGCCQLLVKVAKMENSTWKCSQSFVRPVDGYSHISAPPRQFHWSVFPSLAYEHALSDVVRTSLKNPCISPSAASHMYNWLFPPVKECWIVLR